MTSEKIAEMIGRLRYKIRRLESWLDDKELELRPNPPLTPSERHFVRVAATVVSQSNPFANLLKT